MQKNNNTAIVGIVAVVVIGALVAGTIVLKPKSDSSGSSTSQVTSSTSSGGTTVDPTATYKDGTYSTTASYASPGGTEDMKITMLITNGTITESSVVAEASNRESRAYQNDFIDGYASQTNGKALATLQLSRVSGASLTSRSFNEALDIIRSQAKM